MINNISYQYAAKNYSEYNKTSPSAVRSKNEKIGESATYSNKNDAAVISSRRNASDPIYTERTSLNQNATSQNDGTTFPIPSIIAKYEKYTKVIDEHYAKVNEENKKFDNPARHIWDKYYNTKSPYYVKGLTQREREICSEAEKRVLNGLPAAVNSYDPIIQKTFGGGIINDAEWNDEVRNGINNSVNQLFEENGIIIPEGTDLRLRVDPYDYNIHVSGVDEALARQIEQVLNQGKNGKYLYEHLRWCNPAYNGFEQPKQYLYDTAYQGKAVMWHFVNDLTGLDMRKLENKDGIIYTPDGQNLWDVVTERYNELRANGEIDDLPMVSLYGDYKVFAKEGWDNEEERGLTIGYKNGSLYDIDTDYGYGSGQRTWLENEKVRHRQYWEGYQKEKDRELYKERATPSTFEQWIGNQMDYTNEVLSEIKSNSYGKNGVSLTQPDINALQILVNALARRGRIMPLTNEILHLPQESMMQKRFDAKI